MSGSQANMMTQPAVSASGEALTLLIEKFNGEVHKAYSTQEGLINKFQKQSVTGTNMVSNKFMSRSELQKLTPGQEAEATNVEFDKNALIVDTVILARNFIHDLHRLQNDFEVMSELAMDQANLMREHEDRMVIQQLVSAGLTGGTYDLATGAVTGGTARLKSHGMAVKTNLSTTQGADPVSVVAALEIAVLGLIRQKVNLQDLVCRVPLEVFSQLVDYGYVDLGRGGESMFQIGGAMTGSLRPFGITVEASVIFSEEKAQGAHTSLLSNANNGDRYDWTTDMSNAIGVVYGRKALLVGETISMQSDLFYDKKVKGNFIDTWMSNGATSDRYDNVSIVTVSGATDNTSVKNKAAGKAVHVKTQA